MLQFGPVDCISEGVGNTVGRLLYSAVIQLDGYLFRPQTKQSSYKFSARFKALLSTRGGLCFCFCCFCYRACLLRCCHHNLCPLACSRARAKGVDAAIYNTYCLRENELVRVRSTITVKKGNCTSLAVGKYRNKKLNGQSR